MAAGAIIGGIGLALTATSIGLSASGALAPSYPNLSASSAAMATAEANMLPGVRRIQAAAELGQRTLAPNVGAKTPDAIREELNQLQSGQFGAPEGHVARIQQLQTMLGNVPPGTPGDQTLYFGSGGVLVPKDRAFVDFSGFSQADIQGKIMEALAQGQLDTSKKYDAQFIASALAEEKLADPQRFAARDQLYQDIQKQLQADPVSPVATDIEKRVTDKVNAGSGLTAEEQAMLDEAVKAGTGDRGGAGPRGDFSRDLTTGFAGSAREMANAGQGTAWLSSGQTPQDVQYRVEQQNLANLQDYISGKTPQSQFRELSGAQSGPTPIGQGAPLANMNPDAGAQGAAAGVSSYEAGVQSMLGQVNPWLSGTSALLGSLNVAGAAGWKPLATQSQTAGVA